MLHPSSDLKPVYRLWRCQYSLLLAEYAYNNSLHSSMGATPFQVSQGLEGKPLLDFVPPSVQDPDLIQWWKVLTEQWDLIEKSLDLAKEHYKYFADKKREPNLSLKSGDFVYISTKNLRRLQPARKLAWKYLGPFEVQQCINDVTVK